MSGSQKGERRGGRKVGTPNKKTADLLDMVTAFGKTPLEFFCWLMNDEDTPIETRIHAGEVAMPYVHSRRPILTDGVDGGGSGIQIIINGTDAKL